jgi:hypothetical protein
VRVRRGDNHAGNLTQIEIASLRGTHSASGAVERIAHRDDARPPPMWIERRDACGDRIEMLKQGPGPS